MAKLGAKEYATALAAKTAQLCGNGFVPEVVEVGKDYYYGWARKGWLVVWHGHIGPRGYDWWVSDPADPTAARLHEHYGYETTPEQAVQQSEKWLVGYKAMMADRLARM